MLLLLLLQLLVFAPGSCFAEGDAEDDPMDDGDLVVDGDPADIACYELLMNADGDSDLQLDEPEYLTLLQEQFAGCPAYANATNLTDAQQLAFTTTACTCIAATFNFSCCDPPLWYLPEDVDDVDEFALTGACLAATTAAVADGCNVGDILDDVATGMFGNGTDDGRSDAPNASPSTATASAPTVATSTPTTQTQPTIASGGNANASLTSSSWLRSTDQLCTAVMAIALVLLGVV